MGREGGGAGRGSRREGAEGRDIYIYILMEKSYCALYKLTGQVTGTHPRVEIASGQSLGHVL